MNNDLILYNELHNRLDELDAIEKEMGDLTDAQLHEYSDVAKKIADMEKSGLIPKEHIKEFKYQFNHKRFKKWNGKMFWRKKLGIWYYNVLIITPMILSFVHLRQTREADFLSIALMAYSVFMLISVSSRVHYYNQLVESCERGDTYVKHLEEKIDSLEETIDLLRSKVNESDKKN